MTKGEQRRQRLGEHAVTAARESARAAAPPDPALADALTVLLALQIVNSLGQLGQADEQSA